LKDRLKEIGSGHIQPETRTASLDDGFRSRAKFRVYKDGKGQKIEGTDPKKGPLLADHVLWILPDWSRQVIKDFISILDSETDKARVDGFEVRLSHGLQQLHVTLNAKKTSLHDHDILAGSLVEMVPEIIGVAIPSKNLEFGKAFLKHRILDEEMVSHYRAFFQPNIQMTPVLLQDMKNEISDLHPVRIIDLFCGVGLFSLLLTSGRKAFQGYDSDPWAIRSAKTNAENFGVDPRSYSELEVEKAVRRLDLKPTDLLILDPPRQGCPAEVTEILSRGDCRQVCLVSCYLETQIRDIKHWIREGFEVQSFRAYDAFPFTNFLETVCLMKKS
jgi:23S rRNA (uracil1939-C5)-methyltransferase